MKYVQNKVMYERMEGSGYIVREVDGIPYLEGVISLNEIGADIWEYLNIAREKSEIVEYICTLYDVGQGEVDSDIDAFLESMKCNGIIRSFE